jgi:hypothetical protein
MKSPAKSKKSKSAETATKKVVKKTAKKAVKDDKFFPVADKDLDKELFKRNLDAFKEWLPRYADIVGNITETHSRLVKNAEGEFDIEFRGGRLYGMGHETWARKRTKNFHIKQGCRRITLAAPDTRSLDDESNVTVYNIMKRAVESDIGFTRTALDAECFHLSVFGIGLAAHLPIMERKTACQNMIIVEPNVEFLYLSMYVFDWKEFIERLLFDGRHMTVVIETDARRIAETVRDQMRYINPSFMEGATFLISYPNSAMGRALDILLNERETLTVGLGFLEDEIDMVRNSFHNLKDFRGKFFDHQKDPLHLPAFVIGSGPSLDNDLDFIRANQRNAVIVSCGTSMRILLHNGITPDFHVELENVPIVSDLMKSLTNKFDLSPVTLVATTTVDPGVAQYFKKVIYYFRNGLASYPMFAQGIDSSLHYSTPMVTNLGFSLAQEIGCRTIYNFGVDLGARDPKKHHAKDAPYDAGEADFDTTIDQPTPGNFGGTVFSEMLYMWAKQTMEFAMNRYSAKSIYYNCSDGVRLEGMTPKLSSTIKLPERTDKADVLAKLYDRMPDYTEELFDKSWYKYEPRARMTELRDKLLKVSRTGRNPTPMPAGAAAKRTHSRGARYPLRYMMHIVRMLIPPTNIATPEMHYFRGSTFMFMAAVIFYVYRVPKGPKRNKFLKIVKEEFIAQIERIDERIQRFYDTLDASTDKDPAG